MCRNTVCGFIIMKRVRREENINDTQQKRTYLYTIISESLCTIMYTECKKITYLPFTQEITQQQLPVYIQYSISNITRKYSVSAVLQGFLDWDIIYQQRQTINLQRATSYHKICTPPHSGSFLVQQPRFSVDFYTTK